MICVDQFEVFRYTNRSIIAAYGSQTSRFSVGFSGGNSEKIVKQPTEVFSRKHRAHCLNAVAGYWCKIAEHCKQIFLPIIAKCSLQMQLESSRSLTRADENGSGDIDISLGYRRRGSVSSELRSCKNDTPKYNR